jgi:hypothetical protein
MLSQRIPNMAGVCATEHSPFGYLALERDRWGGDMGKISGYEKIEKQGKTRTDPFNELYIRTWRDLARYLGPETLGQEGPAALMRLPALMEDVLEAWEKARNRPQFKAEYIVTHAITGSLAEGARISAARVKMNRDETDALVNRFVGYTRELTGSDVKPVPPFLFEISKDSRDHSPEVYQDVIMPGFRAMKPAPKIGLTRFGAGVHSFWKAEKDLPAGIVPSVIKSWNLAVMNGYFIT